MSKSFRTRAWIVLASSVTLTVSTGTVGASADDDPPPPPETTTGPAEEAAPPWPPADTDGEWLPVPAVLFQGSAPVAACGTTVVVATGDVFDVEYQAMVQADGTTRVEYRGESTTDVTRESDGAMIDELDTGGPWTETYSADGLTVTFAVDGASIYFAFDEVEAAAFAAAGLPSLFWFESGSIVERLVRSDDPAALTVASAEVVVDTARGVRDVCDMLDEEVSDHS